MKIERVEAPTGMTVECDGYVPLVARNVGELVYCEKYWMTGDCKDTILKFGIEPASGAICKVTIPLLNQLSQITPPTVEPNAIEDGTPCVDLQCWPESVKFLEDLGSPVVAMVKDRLVIRFSRGDQKHFHGIRNGRLIYVVNEENDLSGLEVLDLSPQEIDNIMCTLSSA
jgi:hypothetical protein